MDGNAEQVRIIAAQLAEAIETRREQSVIANGLRLSFVDKAVATFFGTVMLALSSWTVITADETARELAVVQSQVSDLRSEVAQYRRLVHSAQRNTLVN